MRQQEKDFITDMAKAASEAQHPWPEYAACEIALESAFGQSELFKLANNGFGMKAHSSTMKDHILSLPTKEWVAQPPHEVTIMAFWAKYDSISDCFKDRMGTLERLSQVKGKSGQLLYPHYLTALEATSGEVFIQQVSLTWSTDPYRGKKVLDIYQRFKAQSTPD
jgi:flagellum-specific peptidoglycan hydrolase FlgJ